MFELSVNILPRFFHVLSISGVKEAHLFLENAREYVMANRTQLVECPRTFLVHHFDSGRQVQAKGNVRVRFTPGLKIERMEFDARTWMEFVPRATYGQSLESAAPSRNVSRHPSMAGGMLPDLSNMEKTDQEKQREIARKGGESVPSEKRSFSQDHDLAAKAGRKGGGNVPNEKRSFSQNPALAAQAGRKGGQASSGNFANDRERAARAGRKGGQSNGSTPD